MEGMVARVNEAMGLAAVDTRIGYAILEQTGDEIREGDLLTWSPDEPLGLVRVLNVLTGRSVSVHFLHHRVPGTMVRVNLQL